MTLVLQGSRQLLMEVRRLGAISNIDHIICISYYYIVQYNNIIESSINTYKNKIKLLGVKGLPLRKKRKHIL